MLETLSGAEGFRVSELMMGLIDLSKEMRFRKWEKRNNKGIMLPCANNKGDKGQKLLFVKKQSRRSVMQ